MLCIFLVPIIVFFLGGLADGNFSNFNNIILILNSFFTIGIVDAFLLYFAFCTAISFFFHLFRLLEFYILKLNLLFKQRIYLILICIITIVTLFIFLLLLHENIYGTFIISCLFDISSLIYFTFYLSRIKCESEILNKINSNKTL